MFGPQDGGAGVRANRTSSFKRVGCVALAERN